MNNRALTLSLAMAAFAVYFVYSYVAGIEENTRNRFGTERMVVLAKQDIKEMETIKEAMLYLKPIPEAYVDPAAIQFKGSKDSAEANQELKALVGNIAIVPIKKNEQITYNKLVEPGVRTGLAPQITPGRRAIAVPVNDVSGVSKLVKAGDRVDLIGVIDLGGSKESKISKTLLQDVVVLAAGRSITNNVQRVIELDGNPDKTRTRSLVEDTSFTTVTLEVDPQQAQMMALVMASGDTALWLSLRNNDDTDRVNLGSHVFGDVLGQDINRVQRGTASKR